MCPIRVEDIEEIQHINVIFYEDVHVALTRGRPRVATNPITCKKKLLKDLRSFNLIE